MNKTMRKQMDIEDDILELIDSQDIYTRSDLQGRVSVIVRDAMEAGALLEKHGDFI
jgi:tRNA(Phe) wybutosine-synthesizing methylase Tyw3